MIKKDLIVAVLATFCLSATLFTILPTRSAEYDPWVDLDGDGQISIYDVVQMTSIYGKTGDPARNVNVTNFPLDENGRLRVSTDGGSLRSCNDSERIPIFSTEAQYLYEAQCYLGGVKLNNESEYAFSFNPIGSSYNVTGISISIVVFADRSRTVSPIGPPTRLWVTINGQTEYHEIATEVSLDHFTTLRTAISNHEVIASMRQGINSLRIAVQSYSDYAHEWMDDCSYELALFVEYEYLG